MTFFASCCHIGQVKNADNIAFCSMNLSRSYFETVNYCEYIHIAMINGLRTNTSSEGTFLQENYALELLENLEEVFPL